MLRLFQSKKNELASLPKVFMSKTDVIELLARQHHNRDVPRDILESFVASDTFARMQIRIDSATPAGPATGLSFSIGPIVVDENIRELAAANSRIPRVIILDGKNRHQRALAGGDQTIEAFVGCRVIAKLRCEMTAYENHRQLVERLTRDFIAADTNPGYYLRQLQSIASPAEVETIRKERKRVRAVSANVNPSAPNKKEAVGC